MRNKKGGKRRAGYRVVGASGSMWEIVRLYAREDTASGRKGELVEVILPFDGSPVEDVSLLDGAVGYYFREHELVVVERRPGDDPVLFVSHEVLSLTRTVFSPDCTIVQLADYLWEYPQEDPKLEASLGKNPDQRFMFYEIDGVRYGCCCDPEDLVLEPEDDPNGSVSEVTTGDGDDSKISPGLGGYQN